MTSIVRSGLSVVCQRVSVFLGSHEIDLLPVGKQYSEGGNHSRSVLCLTGLWEEEEKKTEAHVALAPKQRSPISRARTQTGSIVLVLPESDIRQLVYAAMLVARGG